jgi:hypothetical protein
VFDDSGNRIAGARRNADLVAGYVASKKGQAWEWGDDE